MAKQKVDESVESKGITVTKVAPPATVDQDLDHELMAMLPRAEASDFEIQRLTLLQPTSKLPGNPGEIIDSTTGKAIGPAGESFTFVPLFFYKDMAITDQGTGKWKRNELKTPANAHLATFENRVTTDDDGSTIERKERLSILVIKESDLDEPFPRAYRLMMKASSFKEARKFLSEWDIQIRTGQAPFMRVWKVTPKQIVDDKGKYWIYEFAKVMDGQKQKVVAPEASTAIKFWVQQLATKKDIMVQDSAPDDEAAPQAAPTHEI